MLRTLGVVHARIVENGSKEGQGTGIPDEGVCINVLESRKGAGEGTMRRGCRVSLVHFITNFHHW